MDYDKKKVIELLNKILESELAGVVRYTHYSFMVYGYTRIPIVSWLRGQATESITHAQQAGEIITSLGDILREALENERAAIQLYKDLLVLVEGKSVWLEEYARTMVSQEEMHAFEVDKMLRKPGELR
jgi:bacterioferritin